MNVTITHTKPTNKITACQNRQEWTINYEGSKYSLPHTIDLWPDTALSRRTAVERPLQRPTTPRWSCSTEPRLHVFPVKEKTREHSIDVLWTG